MNGIRFLIYIHTNIIKTRLKYNSTTLGDAIFDLILNSLLQLTHIIYCTKRINSYGIISY